MKSSVFFAMPGLIARLLSGGALWRAASRSASASPVKRVDSWLTFGLRRTRFR